MALSAISHFVLLAILVSQPAPEYELPEPYAPPMDVRIVPEPPIIPPIVTPPKVELAPKPEPAPTAAPTPPQPPVPQPRPPEPAPPVAKPSPPVPQPAPPVPTPPPPTPKPAPPPPVAPAPAPTPKAALPLPAPAKPAPLQPAPPQPAAKPAAPAAPAPVVPNPGPPKPAPPQILANPSLLNLHKAKKEAPAGVPTLPLSPPSGPAGQPGSAASAPPAGGGASRLNGLSPFPYGALPSGGPGLRGTLVGCANADAVGLSSAERARCNERFGVEAAHAPVLDGISPAKRAGFDAATARDEADRKYRDNTATQGAPSDPGGIAHGPASTEIFKHNAGDPP